MARKMSTNEYRTVEVEVNESDLENSLKKVIELVHPEWIEHFSEDMTIIPLSGGISNKLYACYPKSKGFNSTETLLFRIYGKNTELVVDREHEIATMTLMQSIGLGPKFYCRFAHGICYEYLPGDIVDQKMASKPDIYTKIAEATASMHLADFKGLRTDEHLETGESLFIFDKIADLIGLLNEDYKSSMVKMTDAFLKKTPTVSQLREELSSIKARVKQYTKSHNSLVVFSHNDLLLGNIIFNESQNVIKFIDYEYAGLNYQAYDIANHFNEFAGVESPDYSLFPSRELQLDWLRIYLTSFYSKLSRFYARQSEDESAIRVPDKVDDAMVSEFYDEVNLFTLLSHLMWAVWSLFQAQNSVLDFDFVWYANVRFDEYFKRKSVLLN